MRLGAAGVCLLASTIGCRIHFDLVGPTDDDGGLGDGPIGTRAADPAVLYLFDEGAGAVVRDRTAAPIDLQIEDVATTTWFPGGLRIDTDSRISHVSLADKIVTPCIASNAVTVELWLKTPHVMQPGTTGPFRIVSLSLDALEANLMLGQEGGGLYLRLRTTTSSSGDGEPGFVMPFAATAVPLHVVVVHRTDGSETLYLDNQLAAQSTRTGTMSTWDPNFKLSIANERVFDRPWLGDYHLMAIYTRALTATEIAANFAAGPDPEL